MKLERYTRTPKPTDMVIGFDPMIIWLDKHQQLVIRRGDQLNAIASVVRKAWRLEQTDAQELVAFWFALGERRASERTGPWRPRELSTKASRRYLAAR